MRSTSFLNQKWFKKLEALDHLWSRAQERRGSSEGSDRPAGGNAAGWTDPSQEGAQDKILRGPELIIKLFSCAVLNLTLHQTKISHPPVQTPHAGHNRSMTSCGQHVGHTKSSTVASWQRKSPATTHLKQPIASANSRSSADSL